MKLFFFDSHCTHRRAAALGYFFKNFLTFIHFMAMMHQYTPCLCHYRGSLHNIWNTASLLLWTRPSPMGVLCSRVCFVWLVTRISIRYKRHRTVRLCGRDISLSAV
jgi:hypothetical protein